MSPSLLTLQRRHLFVLIAVAAVITFTLGGGYLDTPQAPRQVVPGPGSSGQLLQAYERWASGYSESEPSGPVVALKWTRGLSQVHSRARGLVQLDLEQERVSVRVQHADSSLSDVWLVHNEVGEGHSVMPEVGDSMILAGRLQHQGDIAWLDAEIPGLAAFELDLVVLTPADGDPARDRVIGGTTSLFQKIYHYQDLRQTARRVEQQGFSLFNAAQASGITPEGYFPDLDTALVNQGRELFFNETFGGNGRNCGTCHVENDNLALSLKTIAALPDSDPLFIVEQEFTAEGDPNPLYNEFRMEKPAMMRKLGLIVENLNGFRELDGEFTGRVVLRAPNHVLSVRTTLAPPPAYADDGTLPVDPADLVFAERTGWSGDGTPTGFNDAFFNSNGRDLTGSLRDFAIGAITQHFTRSLDRSPATVDEFGNPRQPDFRFATEAELDAMEAFMLSIGRQQENDDLDSLMLLDELAERGRLNYMGFNVFDTTPGDGRPALNCNSCHFNGGSNTDPGFAFPAAVTPLHDLADLAANGGTIPSHNRSFAPQVDRLADQAADIIAQTVDDPSVAGNCFAQGLAEIPLLPGDGPAAPSLGCDANLIDNGFAFGLEDPFTDLRIADNRFNAPVVFESVDNPPFFHGHQINTVEGAVAFYATNRLLRNGDFLPAIVPLNGAQVANVARFMRVMGADFNAESAHTLLAKAQDLNRRNDRIINARLALAEVDDAIELLDPVDLHIEDAVPLLHFARTNLTFASLTGSRFFISRAQGLLDDAQDAMLVRNL